MMLGLFVVVLACRPRSDDTAPGSDSRVEPTDDSGGPPTAAPRPTFVEPADAPDSDPDPDVLHVALIAAPFRYTIGDATVDGAAYDEQVPGPTLRAKVGDTVVVDFENALGEPTTIHWHGMHVPWEMDGITWMQSPIDPGETFTYTFAATSAGTFWYHPHFDGGSDQTDAGLYGAIVIADPADPVPDADIVLVLDAGIEQSMGEAHGTRAPDGPWTVNGLVDPELALPAGSSVRARFINASNTGYLDLAWPDPRQVGGDQGLLAAAATPSSLVLSPGDRAELEWSVGTDGFAVDTLPYSLAGGSSWGEREEVLTVTPSGTGEAPTPLPWAFTGAAPSADPTYTDIVWVFQGDGDHWMINGETFPDVTVPEVAYGAPTIIELRNLSSTEHPFHLHGNSFEVLSVDGVPPPVQDIEDTVDVPIRSIVRVRLVATNPGDWMAHCHILPHAMDGMMTVIRVADP